MFWLADFKRTCLKEIACYTDKGACGAPREGLVKHAKGVTYYTPSGESRDPIRVVPSSQDPKILNNEVLSDEGSSTVKCSVYTDFKISEIYTCITAALIETWSDNHTTNCCEFELMTTSTILNGVTATPGLNTMLYELYKNCVHAMWTCCLECGNMYSNIISNVNEKHVLTCCNMS